MRSGKERYEAFLVEIRSVINCEGKVEVKKHISASSEDELSNDLRAELERRFAELFGFSC